MPTPRPASASGRPSTGSAASCDDRAAARFVVTSGRRVKSLTIRAVLEEAGGGSIAGVRLLSVGTLEDHRCQLVQRPPAARVDADEATDGLTVVERIRSDGGR